MIFLAEEQLQKQKHGFQPGVSGNPGGRPKGATSIVAAIKRKVLTGEADTVANRLIVLATTEPDTSDSNAVKLHQWAIDTILDRIDGRTPEKVEFTETPSDLSEFTTDDLEAFRQWLKERKAAQSD